MTAKVSFHEEVQLCGWSESHTSGPKVTFWLADPEQLSTFRGLTERKAKQAGHRFYMTLVEINDDETTDAEPAHEKLGPLALLAVQWARDPKFQAWAGSQFPAQLPPRPLTQEECRMLVLDTCRIGSRRELDVVPSAGEIFKREIRGPFMAYLEGES